MLIDTPTMVDWNWFFAAFAQCGAALIGIISAFIISKLLAEDNKYDSIKIKLENLKIARDSERYFKNKNIRFSF